jgi:hypothetical protein
MLNISAKGCILREVCRGFLQKRRGGTQRQAFSSGIQKALYHSGWGGIFFCKASLKGIDKKKNYC